MAARLSKIIPWVIAAFYGYGALVHVMNMGSLNGFDWLVAPLKWQVLDVVYLGLDLAVMIGLPRFARFGIAAFLTAAISQILLYTAFRGWILDVPEAFARPPEAIAYLDMLVAFHVVTLGLFAVAVLLRRRERV